MQTRSPCFRVVRALTHAMGQRMLVHMSAETLPERHVKLFRDGRDQMVRIPREFELPGEDAIMRKEGERLIIEPTPPKSLLALLAVLIPLDEDFHRSTIRRRNPSRFSALSARHEHG